MIKVIAVKSSKSGESMHVSPVDKISSDYVSTVYLLEVFGYIVKLIKCYSTNRSSELDFVDSRYCDWVDTGQASLKTRYECESVALRRLAASGELNELLTAAPGTVTVDRSFSSVELIELFSELHLIEMNNLKAVVKCAEEIQKAQVSNWPDSREAQLEIAGMMGGIWDRNYIPSIVSMDAGLMAAYNIGRQLR